MEEVPSLEDRLDDGGDGPSSVELEPILSEAQFDRVIAEAQQLEESVIVLWTANWCRKCTYLKPKLEKLAADYYPRIRFYCVDVNAVPQRLVTRAEITHAFYSYGKIPKNKMSAVDASEEGIPVPEMNVQDIMDIHEACKGIQSGDGYDASKNDAKDLNRLQVDINSRDDANRGSLAWIHCLMKPLAFFSCLMHIPKNPHNDAFVLHIYNDVL
ncbi:hypothetical protein COCNU_09G008650 [Cocos nucifera]|uniref:Thioredoxin domain-containing protein n=1 Tax=Cocos nucifera TaxID=13894 RepID=A0A8K0IKC3_COCNU|nr:hypothetical protein COCNU_09G008650 [Cocos nucifera]